MKHIMSSAELCINMLTPANWLMVDLEDPLPHRLLTGASSPYGCLTVAPPPLLPPPPVMKPYTLDLPLIVKSYVHTLFLK